jgi:hypothetical protein
VLLLLLSFRSANADSIVVYSTFGPNRVPFESAFGYGFVAQRTVAVQFTALESAFLFKTEVGLYRDAGAASSGNFSVSLATDSGNRPAAVLEAWSVNLATLPIRVVGVPFPPVELLSNASPFLAAGAPYWLAVSAPVDFPVFPAVFLWNVGRIMEPHLVLRSDGGPFVPVTPNVGLTPAFRVTGSAEPIPEPGTLTLIGIGLVGIALKRHRKDRHQVQMKNSGGHQ